MTANTTSGQKMILVQYMEKYPTMATNSPGDNLGRDSGNKRWEVLCQKLNINGLPVKNIKGWKKTWAHYKHRAKKKLAENKKSLNKTGGGPFKELKLSNFEEAVADVAKIKAAVCGVNSVKTFCGEANIKESPAEQATSIESALNDLLERSESSDSDISEQSNRSLFLPLFQKEDNEEHEIVPPTLNAPLDKIEIFKTTAESKEIFQNKVLQILTDIRDIKREEVEILKKQAADKLEIENRKLILREQEIKIQQKQDIRTAFFFIKF